MYLVYGMYSDGSGHSHKTVDNVTDLIEFLIGGLSYDYYSVWQTSEHYDDPLEIDLIFTNVPKVLTED